MSSTRTLLREAAGVSESSAGPYTVKREENGFGIYKNGKLIELIPSGNGAPEKARFKSVAYNSMNAVGMDGNRDEYDSRPSKSAPSPAPAAPKKIRPFSAETSAPNDRWSDSQSQVYHRVIGMDSQGNSYELTIRAADPSDAIAKAYKVSDGAWKKVGS